MNRTPSPRSKNAAVRSPSREANTTAETARAPGLVPVEGASHPIHAIAAAGDLNHLTEQLRSLRQKFAPDAHLAIYDVDFTQHGDRLILSGEMDSEAAHRETVRVAEQTGFIRRITRWALDRAVAQGAAWYREGKPLMLAVNISAEDVADPLLDQRVAAALHKHQLPPELLTLEVTESGFIEDPGRALKMLEALSTIGVRLSIDDFGTGYSSLSYLARMPVNELKIDRSFVQGLETDADFAAIVSAAIDMGHRLNLKVVAEGIENEASAARLRELQCDLAQGFHFAKPMPRAELEKWLEGRPRVDVSVAPRCLVTNDVGVLDATDLFKVLKHGS